MPEKLIASIESEKTIANAPIKILDVTLSISIESSVVVCRLKLNVIMRIDMTPKKSTISFMFFLIKVIYM